MRTSEQGGRPGALTVSPAPAPAVEVKGTPAGSDRRIGLPGQEGALAAFLLLSLFPLSISWSMRRFGFERLPAALAGLVAPLLSANFLYGLDYGSYVWRGSGLYTQLWGMVLLPPALAQSYRALRDGRGYF